MITYDTPYGGVNKYIVRKTVTRTVETNCFFPKKNPCRQIKRPRGGQRGAAGMHPFYNAYGTGGGHVEQHLYDDNWVAPPSNTPMKDIEGSRQIYTVYFFLFSRAKRPPDISLIQQSYACVNIYHIDYTGVSNTIANANIIRENYPENIFNILYSCLSITTEQNRFTRSIYFHFFFFFF